MGGEVYAKEPLELRGAIPVFSQANEYTDNYEQMSKDRLKSIQWEADRHWLPEEILSQMENSTISLIEKYSKPGDMILDVGIGMGRLLSHFPSLQRYGMDISLSYLEIARTKGIDVCYALVEDMPYKEELFDIIVCTDVLEHVLDLNQSCIKILSVLKTGGTLIVRVPFREELSPYLDPTICPYKYAHLRNFDENSLRLLFERVFDCEIIEMKTAGYQPTSSRLKCPFPFPRRDWILFHLLSVINKLYIPVYETILRALYRPVEINVVVGKTDSYRLERCKRE